MDFKNRVLPEIRESLTSLPLFRLPDDLAIVRQSPLPQALKSEIVRIIDRKITGAGNQEMLIKIFEPVQRDETNLPVLLWIHGGGYVLGHPNGEQSLCESFVKAANCIVISPDYRLAPEHPFPAAIEDCYAALKWIIGAAEEWNIDLSRIAIGGGSAGGGLTAALALMARDKGGPPICFQMPLYPMIDDRNVTPSSHEITDLAVWNRANNLAAWKMYLGEHADGDISPYAAPIRAKDLTGLPPTYTCVGQLDPFRDETIEYVARLAQTGVDVEFQLYPGCYHAFEHVVPDAEVSQRTRNGYANALARAFQR
ncbi:alpha/beta hydrolase fold domain-containing protein [Paenibacillus sp. LMG 31460]|uniref:Alpha/beta hydrolase fold domain-containing protein n=1 Tax=Paenibacillus germinis TaxID=2654979 RepID=A0ABX1Z8P3_9BACL|nr:alpha/beta hydrolase [Paenibacillus germinis]NOU88253.1 alpha/beta hydrolase fold domain-containing protein [Paenibacillus germinis]